MKLKQSRFFTALEMAHKDLYGSGQGVLSGGTCRQEAKEKKRKKVVGTHVLPLDG